MSLGQWNGFGTGMQVPGELKGVPSTGIIAAKKFGTLPAGQPGCKYGWGVECGVVWCGAVCMGRGDMDGVGYGWGACVGMWCGVGAEMW